jgi:hypothetical protein
VPVLIQLDVLLEWEFGKEHEKMREKDCGNKRIKEIGT